MNQTSSIASNLLANPPDELKQLMADPRTSEEARQAIAKTATSPSLKTMAVNGSSRRRDTLTNRVGEGRLQIVNENQEFT